MAKKPVLGFTSCLDYASQNNRYFLFGDNVTAFRAAGAHTIGLLQTTDPDTVSDYLDLIDGLFIPGGEDICASFFGEEPDVHVNFTIREKDEFEIMMIREAVKRGIPVMGICRGLQIINVALGGSLIQDLPSAGYPVCHLQSVTLRPQVTHSVTTEDGSVLRSLMGEKFLVNSLHHQAAKDIAPGMKVAAYSSDGVVEALEHENGRVYAVQFHPESLVGPYPEFLSIFKFFVDLCAK